MSTLDAAHAFLAEDPDPDSRALLAALVERARGGDDDATRELADRFSGPLTFGTAGLRGAIGPGLARMNRVVVGKAAYGLGRYLLDAQPQGVDARTHGVVIGFDGRRMSRQFAEDTAAILAGLGVPAHLFPDPVPTPVLAFAITRKGAAAGVMVTASHNPPEDNGYKVYLGHGGQIVPPHDVEIAARIAMAPRFPELVRVGPPDAAARGLRHLVGDDVARAYLDGVRAASLHKDAAKTPLRVVYTAMHGVGHHYVVRALDEAGFHGVSVVPEQTDPDGTFPTVRFPNPEEPGALDRAFALADEVAAELVVANDPDADRLAVAIRGPDGRFARLSGNAVGVLLGADALRFADTGAAQKLVITTVVSSTMLSRIARGLGAAYEETLTGFKWIADRAITRAREGKAFVLGYEEALGYSVGPMVRDKDGVSAVVRLVELAAHLKSEGRTLKDELDALAVAYGLAVDLQWSVVLPGAEGKARIDAMMETLRKDPPSTLGGRAVVEVRDLARPADGAPAADVLAFITDDGLRLTARPSGTEPKIKFYLEAAEDVDGPSALDAARARARKRLDEVRGELMARLGGKA